MMLKGCEIRNLWRFKRMSKEVFEEHIRIVAVRKYFSFITRYYKVIRIIIKFNFWMEHLYNLPTTVSSQIHFKFRKKLQKHYPSNGGCGSTTDSAYVRYEISLRVPWTSSFLSNSNQQLPIGIIIYPSSAILMNTLFTEIFHNILHMDLIIPNLALQFFKF